MAHMVKMRAVPTALRSATARGEHQSRHTIRAIQTRRGIATDAATREPSVEFPGGVPPVPVPQRRSALEERIAAVREAKPFSDFLTDTFNRQHDYLRISITERCNLRCLYCMPEEGIPLSPNENMLTTPEIFYLSSLFVSQGVTKIRLTGGEPTIRRDIIPLMQQLGSLRPNGLRELALTTNGIALHRKLDAMVESGLTGVNLSLDTLDPFQFQIMTRRKGFDAVMKSIDRILEMNKLGANVKLKVNCVVMRGLNEREILPFVELGREKDIEVRFIEYMPFGGNKWSEGKMISFQEMLDIIRAKYPDLRRVPGHKNDTSKTFEVPGFVGKVGFITSMTNDFCGSCNRLRITSDGNLKVCLHGNAEVSLRDVLRQGNDGQPIDEAAFERIKQIEMDRHEGRLSDETILGWGQRERELLDVVGAAVKRKAEKHADMGDLKNMTNRPMILIDKEKSIEGPYPQRRSARHNVGTTYPLGLPLRTTPNLPRSTYSLLSATFPSNTTAIRAYHYQPSSSANGSKQEGGPLVDNDMQLPPNSEELPQHEKVLLEAVWENGITESSPLPASAEAVRQKYDMAGPEYDYYWQLAAGSLLKVLHVNAKARRKLRAIEQEKLSDGSIIPKTADHEPSSHKTLMNQVRQIWKEERRTKEMGMKFDGQQNVKDNPLAFQNSNRYQARDVSSSIKSRNQNMEAIHSLEDSRDVEKGSQDSQDISQVVEDLLADMDRHVPKIAYSEIFGANDMDRNAPRFSKSDSFEVDVQPLEHVAKGTKTLRFGSRTQEPEQRDKPVNKTFRIGSRAKEPEQQDASKVQKAERTKKLRELSQLRLDLQKKKQELSDRLRAEEEAQILAKKRRDEAPYLERIAKEASSELIDILDVAIEKNVEKTVPTKDQTLALPFNRSRTAHPAARSPKLASTEVHTLPTPSQSLISGSQPAQEVQEQPSDATIEIVLDRAPSDDLRLSVPASGEIPIDSSLTLTLNSDTTTLQSQVLAMQSRLSASYPRIDTLPYNIAESKNTQTLQTWLKILASRWQSRFDKVEDTAQMDPQVKAVLDQMVRDHDLSNPAAKRMAEKWGEIFKRRAALTRDTDDILDDEEFEAGGMSFLRVDEAEVEGMTDSSERVEDDSMSVVTQAVEPSRTEITPEEHEAIIVEESTDDKPFAADHFDTEGSERSEQLKPKTIPLIEPTKTSSAFNSLTRRLYSTSSRPPLDPSLAPKPEQPQSPTPQPTSPSALPHLTPSGSAHMVSVSSKAHTVRTAIAVGTVYFSNSTPLSLIQSNSLKKGDVLSVSRIAGIMAAKKCPDLIPLCHPIALTHVGVELRVFSPETNAEQEKADANDMGFGGVAIEAKVACTGPTGVEMEALTSVMGTALSVVDMCKAVDKFMRVQDVRVVLKEGGKSGVWREKGWRSWQE